MRVGVHKDLSDVDAIDQDRHTLANREFTQPETQTFEVGYLFVVDTFLCKRKPGLKKLVGESLDGRFYFWYSVNKAVEYFHS